MELFPPWTIRLARHVRCQSSVVRTDGVRNDGGRTDGVRPSGARAGGASADGARADGANTDGAGLTVPELAELTGCHDER